MAISSIKVLESRFVRSCAKLAQAPQIQCAEIAILGRSNVGKSSLINALLNRKNLAKSSSTPGKTRLVNFFESKWRIALDCGEFNESTHPLTPSAREGGQNVNHPAREGGQNVNPTAREGEFLPQIEFTIHILDFPGFGYAKVSKAEKDSWDKNLSAFLRGRESIKLFIHLMDSRHENLKIDSEIRAFLHAILRADADILEVFTKADKLKKSEIYALKGNLLVSILDKKSVESLRYAILQTMYKI